MPDPGVEPLTQSWRAVLRLWLDALPGWWRVGFVVGALVAIVAAVAITETLT